MWSLAKTIVGAAFLGVLAYAVFFVDLGGKSLAAHLADVWREPVVQQKLDQVRDGVKEKIEDRLAEAGRDVSAQASRKAGALRDDGITEADRQALVDVLGQVSAKKR